MKPSDELRKIANDLTKLSQDGFVEGAQVSHRLDYGDTWPEGKKLGDTIYGVITRVTDLGCDVDWEGLEGIDVGVPREYLTLVE